MTTFFTPARLVIALFAAALAGAAAPEATVLVVAHAALLAGGIQLVRLVQPEHA